MGYLNFKEGIVGIFCQFDERSEVEIYKPIYRYEDLEVFERFFDEEHELDCWVWNETNHPFVDIDVEDYYGLDWDEIIKHYNHWKKENNTYYDGIKLLDFFDLNTKSMLK
jgi:hypothetical protein